MTQPNILELAKQGDAQAIAGVISYFMQNEGVTAKAALKDNLLELIVEASQIPNQQQSVAQIQKIFNHLQLKFINKIKIYGK